ncbi:MAG: ABC transporter permease [Acidobacteria bacterium]|nr:ABC transporter permease [Acidobacteriota bacterium]
MDAAADKDAGATPPEPSDGPNDGVAPPAPVRDAAAGVLDWLRIREELPLWLRWLLGAIPILLLFGLWWWATAGARPEDRMISPTILPSPLEVAHSFRSLWFDRALTRNLFISLGRVVSGFAVGVAVALPLGVLMGSFSKVKATFSPLAVLGAYLPIPALVPLTLSLFGIGEKQKVAFLALAFLIYLLPLVVAAVDEVDEVYLKTAYTLGATKLQAVTKVLLAISWPDIFQALRLGFGIGWSYILLAEMVDINGGLGDIIITSQRRGPREHIYLVLLVIVGVAFVTDKLWTTLGRALFPYRRET